MTTSASLFDDAWLSLNQAGRLLDRDAFDRLPEPSAPRNGLAGRLRDALAQAPSDPRGEAFGALLDPLDDGLNQSLLLSFQSVLPPFPGVFIRWSAKARRRFGPMAHFQPKSCYHLFFPKFPTKNLFSK